MIAVNGCFGSCFFCSSANRHQFSGKEKLEKIVRFERNLIKLNGFAIDETCMVCYCKLWGTRNVRKKGYLKTR
ncbi:hypothetical protein DFP97_10833 [Paenibacillus prosopidis]|uniref:Uncharacterized protein n=1 Tax=Paenibacillus prosopidis TaxID=630520 RepID=A0A368VZN2_9BACL|nr:hypothetical protein DFP97_10833 [Paenibacillus prosopidis]